MESQETPQKIISHEELIKQRDDKLVALESELKTDPHAEWQTVPMVEGLSVELPKRAVIETEALIQDIKSHLVVFQSGPQSLMDHGDIARNPRTFGLTMKAIFEGVRDYEGLQKRIELQRGMTIYIRR